MGKIGANGPLGWSQPLYRDPINTLYKVYMGLIISGIRSLCGSMTIGKGHAKRSIAAPSTLGTSEGVDLPPVPPKRQK